jgi:hypothetical protein
VAGCANDATLDGPDPDVGKANVFTAASANPAIPAFAKL